ncbi:MAG: GspE/PulE family protein [Rivihabitans pingtungensis]
MSALAARLGDTLLARGWLDADQLDIAQAEVRAGRPLEQALAQLGFVPDGVLRDTLAELLGLDSLEARALVADSTALAVVPAHWARQLRVLPLRYAPANQTLTIASARPADLRAHDQLVAASQGQVARVHVQLADEADILQALDRAYGAPDTLSAVLTEWRSGQQDGEAPAVRLAQALIEDAARLGASDIHLEPEAGFVRIRYRIDGVLRPARSLRKAHWPPLLVRLKVMGGLNIAEQRAPQDGQLSMQVAGRTLDIRVACLPTLHGENLSLRLFDRARGLPTLASLTTATQHAQLTRMLARPEGMLLVTGPTGAGKTTTLYAMLAHLNDSTVNIMTLEDPVEYPLPMVRQTPVNEALKLDFASGIRALMRQDPDILLVGEIRDEATARMAFRAAMTGHLVLSTLHAHSALGAIPRLLDLGVGPDMLAGNLIGVVGQRLVRALCPACRQPVPTDSRARRWPTCAAMLANRASSRWPRPCAAGCWPAKWPWTRPCAWWTWATGPVRAERCAATGFVPCMPMAGWCTACARQPTMPRWRSAWRAMA